MRRPRVVLLIVLALCLATAAHADQLAAISFDGFSSSTLTTGLPGAPANHALTNIYNTAGLTYAGGSLYAISNDSFGFAIDTLSLTGAPSGSPIALPGGYAWSGLAYSGGLFYSVGADFNGNAALFSITGGGAATNLGTLAGFGAPFPGGSGLAFAGSTLYGLSTDLFGDSSLVVINLDGTLGTSYVLGIGFNGGLAYGGGSFYSVANDWLGNSTLMSFTLGGIPIAGPILGQGYYGGLAYVPENNGVPEPSTLLLLISGGLGVVARLKAKRRT